MALAAILASLSGLPADLASHYVEKDGKFYLQVNAVDGFSLENVNGLKTALGSERTRASDLSEKLKAFEGLDSAKAREALAKYEEFKNFDPEKKVTEALKLREQELLAGAERKNKALESEKSKLLSQLHNEIIVRSATQAISEAEGNVPLLLPHVVNQMKLRAREDGTFIPTIVDGSGVERIGDGNGNPMTVKQLVASMRESETFMAAFKASNSGGGAAGAGGKPDNSGGKLKIKANDGAAISANLEAVAAGKATIVE